MNTTEPTAVLAEAYAAEIDAATAAMEKLTATLTGIFAGSDDDSKLRRMAALMLAVSDRDSLAGLSGDIDSFGHRRWTALMAARYKLEKQVDGSIVRTARTTILNMVKASRYTPTWKVFTIADFGPGGLRGRDDFFAKDIRPGTGHLFARWDTLRSDHPLRDLFKVDDLIPLEWGPAVCLTDNKLVASYHPSTVPIFEAAHVKQLTAIARSEVLKQERERAEAEAIRQAEEEAARLASPEHRIEELERRLAEAEAKLAAK